MIYLDHAATSPLDPRVLEAMLPYLRSSFGNPGSLHRCGREAKKAVDLAREQVAAFFNCDPEQVIFTSGGSEGNNTVLSGVDFWMKAQGKTGIMISRIEHDSVWKAAHAVCMKPGFHLSICEADGGGEVRLPSVEYEFEKAAGIGLASVMYANNETGVVNDVAGIAEFCHRQGALMHSDAVQAAGILPLDVRDLQVDFLTVSAHKFNGPKGVGALYAKDASVLSPLILGGADQEFGYRGGTENVPGIVGMGEACRLSMQEQTKNFRYLSAQHSQLVYMLRTLAESKGVPLKINGELCNMAPKTLNVCFPGADAETLLLMLDARQIFLSAGSACRAHENVPSRVLKAMGLSDEEARCSVRISLSHLNTPEELDEAARAIVECAAFLQNR